MTFAVKYEHVSAFASAPGGSSDSTPTFPVKVKGVLQVTAELHLVMHMVVCLLA